MKIEKILFIFVMIVFACSSLVYANADSSIVPSHLASVSSLPSPQNFTNNVAIPFHPINSTAFAIAKNQAVNPQNAQKFATSIPGAEPYIKPYIVSVTPGGFDGISQSETPYHPPDVAMGEGPNHIVEFVNVVGKVWDKNGTPASSLFQLYSFFGAANTDFLTDPRIMYDSQSGRWFASILDVTTSSVKIAVSSTNNPTDAWTVYDIIFGSTPGPGPGTCPDQPKIGLSNDKFVVSGNDFSNFCTGSFLGADFFVFDKSQLISGSTLNKYSRFGPDLTKSSITPAQSLSSTNPLYMTSVDSLSSTKVHFFTLTGLPTGLNTGGVTKTLVDLLLPPALTINTPPSAVQADPAFINTGDNRILDAKWSQGKLWISLNDACVPLGDSVTRSCARLIQINTASTPTILQDFDIGFSGYYVFYPAISIEGSGSLDVIAGYSTPASYPSLFVTGQSTTSASGTYQISKAIAFGSTPNTDGRYGDYFSAVMDPSNNTKSWVAGEYMHLPLSLGQSTWSTFIAATTVTNPSLSLSASSGTVGNTITVKGGFFDDNVLATIKYDGTVKATSTTDANGNFSIPLVIPSSVFGSHQISALVPNYSTLTSTFTVNQSLSIDTSSGPVGTSVSVSGNGFAASSSTAIKYGGVTQTMVTTNSTGSFKTTMQIPQSPQGPSSISAIDAASHTDLKTFSVTPKITITPTTGSSSTSIVVTGTGFAANSLTTVRYDGIVKNTVTTDSTGSFTATIQPSSSVVGNYLVSATDSSSNSASAQFTFTSNVTVLPSSGPVGTSVTMTGSGLSTNSLTTIKYDGVNQTTTTTNSTGGFNATFSIPSSTLGAHQITATDAGNHSLSSTFIVVLPGQVVFMANDTAHTFTVFTPTVPTISLSPPSAGVGHVITITGAHFAPLHAITIKFGDVSPVVTPTPLKSDSTGAFTATFVVPLAATVGNHTLTVFSSGNTLP